MRFSAMRFSTKVFEHDKITRWRHCNTDSLKTLKADYMLYIQGGPKKVSHHQFFQKIALKIANEIRFLREVKV